jgi:hypothetical protein
VHPWGTPGIWASTILVMFWIALGSWEAVFPGTLEPLFGLHYDFHGNWSVTRATFEVLTLGTLAVIVLFGLIGYLVATPLRKQIVSTEVDGPEPAELPPDAGEPLP